MRINSYEPSLLEETSRHWDVQLLRSRIPALFYSACIILVVAVWILSAIRVPTPAFPFDDSYIALHSAQVLRAGKDTNFVGTPALSGVTSIAHVMLVSVLLNFFQPVMALQVSLWIAVLAYMLGLARLAFVNGANWMQAALLVFVGMMIGNVPHHLFNGLETGLALAGLTWALAIASDPKLRLRPWVPLLYAQLPFLRPEMALVVALLLALRFWQRRTAMPDVRAQLRAAASDMGLLALGAIPWLMAYYASTGFPFPTTIAAKNYYFAESCWPFASKWELGSKHLVSLVSLFGLFSLALISLFLSPIGRLGFVFLVTLIGTYLFQFPDAIGQYQLRYMHILVPFLLFGLASTFLYRSKRVRLAGTVLLALTAVQATWAFPTCWKFHRFCNGVVVNELEGLASWTRTNLPPDSVLLIHDAGYLSFATHFRMFDMVGLKTPEFVPLHRVETNASCGGLRSDALNRIAILVHPNYVIVSNEWDQVFGITAALRNRGWRLEPMRPGTPLIYQVYRATPPDPRLAATLH